LTVIGVLYECMIDEKEVIKQQQKVILEVKTSRTDEQTPEAMKQLLSSLVNLKKTIIPHFWSHGVPFSLEIALVDQFIYFYFVVAPEYQGFIESQLISQYPKALINKLSKDYLPPILEKKDTLSFAQFKLINSHLYPLRTYTEFKEVDPLSSLLGVLSKAQLGDMVSVQFLLLPIGSYWQKRGESAASSVTTDKLGKSSSNPYSKEIMMKVAQAGFQTAIRVAVNSPFKERSDHLMIQIANSFSSYSTPLNRLVIKKPLPWQRKKLIRVMQERSNAFMPRMQILNVDELATMFHFPSIKLALIHNISWHKVIVSDPPENLTVAENLTEEDKSDVNFFAKTEYKNRMTVFGLKKNDRRRHVYVIGKTGSGKSTLIANMAINDMRNNRGFCIIDPHGDLCEVVLNYVPSYRINDVIYLDPSNSERAVAINPLETFDDGQKELTVSGIVAIFNKLYGTSWGPRLEYILRNTLLSVIQMPEPTMMMVPEMLGNDKFRAKVVERITDPVLRSFWLTEFNKYSDKMRTEAVSPIQNKVGQFLSSTVIRNILKNPKSTLDIRKTMDEGKILLLNLSQGKLGEDNAALLGAMIITKIQLAAMSRVDTPEDQRKDFYLYVDEFQNFATSSFIKILSEARKYRLNLILANQYIAQIAEDVRAAIFGNAGTMMSFLVGATDAAYLAQEYKERFVEADLLALGNYRAIIKLAIDNVTMPPFLCYSLPLPRSVTQAKEKVLRNSLERYTKEVIPEKIFIADEQGPAGGAGPRPNFTPNGQRPPTGPRPDFRPTPRPGDGQYPPRPPMQQLSTAHQTSRPATTPYSTQSAPAAPVASRAPDPKAPIAAPTQLTPQVSPTTIPSTEPKAPIAHATQRPVVSTPPPTPRPELRPMPKQEHRPAHQAVSQPAPQSTTPTEQKPQVQQRDTHPQQSDGQQRKEFKPAPRPDHRPNGPQSHNDKAPHNTPRHDERPPRPQGPNAPKPSAPTQGIPVPPPVAKPTPKPSMPITQEFILTPQKPTGGK
jgi:hypothetical protein